MEQRRIEGKDIFSMFVVGCATFLIAIGRDSIVGWCLLGIVGLYYGVDLSPFIPLGRNKKKKEDK